MMTNVEYANGLRQIADFYDAHPEMPVLNLDHLYLFCYDREQFLRAVKQMAHAGKVTTEVDQHEGSLAAYKATCVIGGISIRAQIDKHKVCRLVSPAVYDCPDSLLAEESAEFQEAE